MTLRIAAPRQTLRRVSVVPESPCTQMVTLRTVKRPARQWSLRQTTMDLHTKPLARACLLAMTEHHVHPVEYTGTFPTSLAPQEDVPMEEAVYASKEYGV